MMLTTRQAGEAIGLTRQAVWKNIQDGRLVASRHGVRGVARIQVEELRRFAARYNYLIDDIYLKKLAEQNNSKS